MKKIHSVLLIAFTAFAVTCFAQNITANDESHGNASEHYVENSKKKYIIGGSAIAVLLIALAARKQRAKNKDK